MPFVSIIMPAYNAERTIEYSVKSVTDQTFQNWELIVIDDGSRDQTPEVLQKLCKKDKRIRILRNNPNAGVSQSRNRGIAEAHGDWIAFLDSDDLWTKDKLECQLSLLNVHPEAVLLYTASAFITNDGEPISYVLPAEERISFSGLLRKNLLSCSSVMVRTDVIRTVAFPGDHLHEDYYAWLTILKKVPYAYGINHPLLIYRLTKNSRSSNAWKSIKMLFRTYRAVGFSPMASCLYIPRYLMFVLYKKQKQKKHSNSVKEHD